ncbi:MAG: helix-turn-helix domain-containing protein [Hyphomicrobiaceae bacterium]
MNDQSKEAPSDPNDYDRAWRERLRARIEAKKLNPKEVARQIGVGLALVYDTLKGRDPSIRNFAKIAEFLGFSLDELYYGAIHPSRSSSISDELIYKCLIRADKDAWEYIGNAWEICPPMKLDVDIVPVLVGIGWPMVEEDDILLCKKFSDDEALDDYSRHLALVETLDGQRLVRKIGRPRLRGQVMLTHWDRSIAPAAVTLKWAAPVIGTLKASVAHPSPRQVDT